MAPETSERADPLRDLRARIEADLSADLVSLTAHHGELTIVVAAARIVDVLRHLRDDPAVDFKELVDLCGVDYPDRAGASTSSITCSR